MKNYLLCFFALVLCFALLPLMPQWLPPPVGETVQTELIRVLDTQTDTVRQIPLEDYVLGVLDAADYPYEGEALKAIAVAVRSCAVYCEQHTPRHANAAACNDPHCCAAYSTGIFSETTVQAVAETAGMLVLYDGEVAAALTHESSGAYTESSLACFGVEIPYLTEVQNIDEQCTRTYVCERQEFFGKLGLPADSAMQNAWLAYDRSGRVAQVEWGETVRSGQAFADTFSLPSTCFSLTCTADTVVITCTGAGNGVGLSRNGSAVLAADGKNFEEILTFYFPGTEIRKLS